MILDGVIRMSDGMLFVVGVGLTAIAIVGAALIALAAEREDRE